jgi:protein phosphatase
VLLPGAALVAHVGDSRVYRLRNCQLDQLTFDHSRVWEMAAASQTSADDVPACIPKNVITRSLGPHAMVNVDLEGPYEVLPGDKFLLCSDGLTTVVDNSLIGSLAGCLPPQEAVDTLVDVANLRGGPDNISPIIVEVVCDESRGHECNGQPTGTPGAAAHRSLWLRLWGWIFDDASNGSAGSELGGPYGNGPYRHYACEAAAAASDMSFLCRELTSLESAPQSPMSSGQQVDWSAFRQGCQQADAAIAAGEHRDAIARFAQAIRKLMAQVRRDDRDGPDPTEHSGGSVL